MDADIELLGYSQSLTGCVTQLEQLCKYTKEIVGEQGYVSLFLYLPSPLRSLVLSHPHAKLSTTSNNKHCSFDPILEDEYEDLTRDQVSTHGFLDGQITPRTTRG